MQQAYGTVVYLSELPNLRELILIGDEVGEDIDDDAENVSTHRARRHERLSYLKDPADLADPEWEVMLRSW
jgi:hypothetical protein